MTSDTQPPSKQDLMRVTAVAAGLAVLALMFFVLPAEYGIDPTGAGDALGLMNEDAAQVDAVQAQAVAPRNATHVIDLPASGAWREVKWELEAGMTVLFSWEADFPVQYDLHHDQLGSFDRGQNGTWHGSFTAPEDGRFGWAFRTPSADATRLVLHIDGFWV